MRKAVIIDDNPLILESLEKTVPWEELNVQVTGVFSNGEEGRDFCLSQEVELVITDIKMPGITGLEILEELRIKRPDIRGIVITGFDEFELARTALRIGVVDLILKPIDNGELMAAVRNAFGMEQMGKTRAEEETGMEKGFSGIDLEKQMNGSVRRALTIMKENLDRRISLGELSDYVGLSTAHLSRLLKKETGKNFVDINNELKVEKAISLLKEGIYKVYEVSNMVGFDNYAYFYQIFKKITGKSPKEYQNN